MSGLKTIGLGLAITMSMANAAQAVDDLTREFAYCTGRYSAEMEHAWLMNDPVAGDQEAKRAAFIALLEAVAPPDAGASVLDLRISAKVAQAALLARASFAEDEETRQRSREHATLHLQSCDGLLLQG